MPSTATIFVGHAAGERFVSLRLMPRDVEADFPHSLDHGWKDHFFRFRAGTLDLETVTTELPEKGLCHLASGGIAGAKKQDPTSHP